MQTRILSSPVSTSVVTTVAEEVTSFANDVSDVSSYIETEPSSRQTEKTCDSIVQSPTNKEDAICDTQYIFTETPVENDQSAMVEHKPKNKNAEMNSQENHLVADMTKDIAETSSNAFTDHEVLIRTIENNDSTSANAKHDLFESNSNDVNVTDMLNNHIGYSGEGLTNGERYSEHFTDLTEKKSKLVSSQDNASNSTTMEINEKQEEEQVQQLQHNNNSSIVRTTSFVLPKKYSKKSSKFVREPTPGPDLDVENGKLIQQFEAVELLDDSCAIANNKLDETDQKTTNDKIALEMRGNKNNKTKMSQDTIEVLNEDSGFESQTRLSEYPITAAVKEWLRRANSPDLFVTSASTSESETDEDDDEEMDAKPPKNLQGNPMPALSANSVVDNVTLSRMASCGEFAKTNNNNIKNNEVEDDSTLISIGRRKRDAKSTKRKGKSKRIDKRNRNVDEKAQNQLVSSLVSCNRLEDFITAVRLKNTPKNNVGDVCEFTQEDSVAGMRVALSSRINSKRVNARRIKTLRKVNRSHVENIDIKMRRIDISNDEKEKKSNEYGMNMVSVRTFEKGEIIVSKDGKLLPISLYEAVPSLNDQDNSSAMKRAARVDVINENVEIHEESRNSSENDENNSIMIASSVSIEEPDVLECWEAETIEPVITPRRMLQSPGVLCEGEAAEEDNFEIERAMMEHVQKYYKLEQNSGISVEEESSEEFSTSVIPSKLKTVPNNSEKTIEHFCSEEIPIFIPNRNHAVVLEDEKIPIDEAFEVYESCYTGKSPFLAFDSKMFKQRSLYGQNGEGPIPCRAVCCNIQ